MSRPGKYLAASTTRNGGAASFEERISLSATLGGLMREWTERLGEENVSWGIRHMTSRWGVCNYVKRRVTFSDMLAGKASGLAEYVVVHELTHLKAHNHGPYFKFLMDSRMPDWRDRRKLLNENPNKKHMP